MTPTWQTEIKKDLPPFGPNKTPEHKTHVEILKTGPVEDIDKENKKQGQRRGKEKRRPKTEKETVK